VPFSAGIIPFLASVSAGIPPFLAATLRRRTYAPGRRLRRVGALAAVAVAGLPLRIVGQTPAWDSPAVAQRVEALLAQMTLADKVGQLNQISLGDLTGPGAPLPAQGDLIARGGVGAIFNVTRAPSINAYQREAVVAAPRHIPLLFGQDVIHGFRTLFPIPLGLSATWDPTLVEATARFAAREAARRGIRWTFSPMVDIARDPRWGRMAEGAGEDPYLGSMLARAYVRGYQGSDLADSTSVLACAKHFVGYGAAEGGREYNTTEISERTLREVYLAPFQAAVEAGAGTIMSAFNALDGVPASANRFTLTTVLRDEWGFRGLVDSDWTSVRELMLHGIADDEATAARKAFLAGVDVDMQSGLYAAHLADLVRSGDVPVARLDEAVRRVLRLKFALGLFEHPYVDEAAAAAATVNADGIALARRAAEASCVLLENRPTRASVPASLLPLADHAVRRIALIGPLADSAEDMLGSWPGLADAVDVVTLRQALADRAAHTGFRLDYTQGTGVAGTSEAGFAAAIAAARAADVVVLALGETGRSSGEAASRAHLDLPGNQEALLEAVVAAGRPVVLIVFSGRPLALNWASAHVQALVFAWFPGLQAGPALTRLLFGDAAPSGRLTVTVPRSVGQIPLYYNALNTGRPRQDPIGFGRRAPDAYYVTGYIDEPVTPLYPFGAGLTYTSFRYGAVSVQPAQLSAAAIQAGQAHFTVAAEVRNTGARPGVETVQLYLRWRGTSVARPVHELKGWRKVALAPGEGRRVEFTLGRDELAFWNLAMRHAVEPGSLSFWIAPDSASGQPGAAAVTP